MTEHEIEIDEAELHAEGAQFKAYCACGWSGDWHHADDFGPVPTTDEDANEAFRAATAQGDDHLTTA